MARQPRPGVRHDAAGQRRVRRRLLLPVALRERHRHQPGGTDRRRPRRLLLHGAVRRPVEGRAHADARAHHRPRPSRQGRRRIRHHEDRTGLRGRDSRHRRRDLSAAGRGCEEELPGVQGADRHGDHPERPACVIASGPAARKDGAAAGPAPLRPLTSDVVICRIDTAETGLRSDVNTAFDNFLHFQISPFSKSLIENTSTFRTVWLNLRIPQRTRPPFTVHCASIHKFMASFSAQFARLDKN
ncbi:protein of unknown function (plasmid) [Azospirillum baldaniorum]|uniref:Uncharacterized protein n=1 Tax=Azospirillum baldaniorum TaxID=1064539 RepID=A0A9P1JXY3_9PROT|nr:protein of unknown function [Azospirillum baldaniorum]